MSSQRHPKMMGFVWPPVFQLVSRSAGHGDRANTESADYRWLTRYNLRNTRHFKAARELAAAGLPRAWEIGRMIDGERLSGAQIVELLAEKGFRRTHSRRVLADVIAAKRRYFSSAELEAEVAGSAPDIGRATLFRLLATLIQQEVLSRVTLPSGEQGYVVCNDSRAHHHHAICTQCGTVVPVGTCGVDVRAKAVEKETSFHVTGHRLEYFGLCAQCSDN